MIHLTHSVSGTEVGRELAGDVEELAYALVAIAENGPDTEELRDYLGGQDQRAVRDLANAIALSLGDD